MQLLEYGRLLRRRWSLIAVSVLVGAVAGFLTAPGVDREAPRFVAVHVLFAEGGGAADGGDGGRQGGDLNLQQAALLVTTGDVPERATARLGPESDVRVDADADPATSSLDVRAEADDPASAVAAANVYAEELLSALSAGAIDTYERQLEQARATVAEVTPQLEGLRSELVAVPSDDPRRPVVEAAFQDANARLQETTAAIALLERDGPPAGPLRTVEAAATGELVTPEGVQAPESKAARAALLAGFGLLLGIGAALAAERLDTRLRGRTDTEAAFGVPVIGEIPPIRTGRRHHDQLLAVARPAAPAMEAFRALRTMLLFAAEADDTDRGAPTGDLPPGRVVIVTSPAAGEGKTTTAANLSAALAEVGKRVLVVSADLRRPRIHALFGRERDPGMIDVFASAGRVGLHDLDLTTAVDGVRLLSSGAPTANPAPYMREAAALVDAARDLFDYIVVDTAPLLVANDASELMATADAVLVVARVDRTRRDAAGHAIELLQRIDAPVLGVVMVGANDTPTAYGYYRSRYYAESEPRWWRRRRQRSSDAGAARRQTSDTGPGQHDGDDDGTGDTEAAAGPVTGGTLNGGTDAGRSAPGSASRAGDVLAANRDPGA